MSHVGPTQLVGVVCPGAVVAQNGHCTSVLNRFGVGVAHELAAPVIYAAAQLAAPLSNQELLIVPVMANEIFAAVSASLVAF